MLKKDKMVAESLNVQIEQTRIQCNNIIYNNHNIIITVLRHDEKLGIVRTVYSGTFWHIQEYSATLSHVQTYRGV